MKQWLAVWPCHPGASTLVVGIVKADDESSARRAAGAIFGVPHNYLAGTAREPWIRLFDVNELPAGWTFGWP